MFSGLLSKLAGGGAPSIEHDDFVRVVQDGSCAIVDVREPQEYASGHVPGARNLPLSRFNPAELPTNKPVILICQAGGRSAKALAMATSAGAAGALDAKTKELIALAIGVATRCDDCIAFHAKAASQHGATKEEVMETLAMSIYMGAGPSVMYASHALAAFNQFDAGKAG